MKTTRISSTRTFLPRNLAPAALAALLVSALALPAWAGPEEGLHVDAVGYDVGSGVFVIHGAHFVRDETPAAPYVEVAGEPVTVETFSEGFITARRPHGLGPGEHRIVVERRGHTDEDAQARAETVYTLADVAPPTAVGELDAPQHVARSD